MYLYVQVRFFSHIAFYWVFKNDTILLLPRRSIGPVINDLLVCSTVKYSWNVLRDWIYGPDCHKISEGNYNPSVTFLKLFILCGSEYILYSCIRIHIYNPIRMKFLLRFYVKKSENVIFIHIFFTVYTEKNELSNWTSGVSNWLYWSFNYGITF